MIRIRLDRAQVQDVGVRVGHGQSDMGSPAHGHAGDTRDVHAHGPDARADQPHRVPDARQYPGIQVGVPAQEGPACGRFCRRNRPVVTAGSQEPVRQVGGDLGNRVMGEEQSARTRDIVPLAGVQGILRMNVQGQDFQGFIIPCCLQKHLDENFRVQIGGSGISQKKQQAQGIGDIPFFRDDTGQPELQVKVFRGGLGKGVDTVCIFLKQGCGPGVKNGSLLPCQAVQADGSHTPVLVHHLFSRQFTESALDCETDQVHLEKTVLGRHKPLGKHHVFQVLSPDECHAFFIPADRDRGGKP